MVGAVVEDSNNFEGGKLMDTTYMTQDHNYICYQKAGEARLDAERFASIGYALAAAGRDAECRRQLDQVLR